MKTKWNYLLLATGLCVCLGVGLTVRGESETMTSGFPDFTNAVLLIGKDPDGNLLVIGVDANGYLTIPLQGDYQGELKTIALDENGRISAITHDGPDLWGKTISVGLAEASARLGSPVAWDRRGNVLLVETFGTGLGVYTEYLSGTGAAVELSPQYALSDGYTLKLTAGKAEGGYAIYQGGLGKPPSMKLGLAARFATYPIPTYFQLTITLYENEVGYQVSYRYDYANEMLQYYDADSSWQDAIAYKIKGANWVMNSMKVVADFSEGEYMRLMLNSLQHDLTVPCRTWAEADTGDFFYYSLKITGQAAENDIAYVDSFVVSVNEP